MKNKYIGFDIEYLPNAKRYFPRCNGQYFFYWHTSKKYSLQKDMGGAEYGETKEEAKKMIDEYIELLGIGTEILSVE